MKAKVIVPILSIAFILSISLFLFSSIYVYKFISPNSRRSSPVIMSLPLPPPPLTESEKQKIIAREIKNLNQGQIRYNPPKEMKVGESDIIEVLIIDSKTENLRKYPLKGTGKAVIESIKVSSDMEAELTGSEFDIKPVSSKKQKLVTEITPTSWQWEVTPKKAGLQQLTLTITANIEINNKKIPPYEYRVFDKNIKVKINPFYSIQEFCQTNLQWLITTIIASFAGFPWLISNWKNIKIYFYKLFQKIRITLRIVIRKLVKHKFSKKPVKQKSTNPSSSNTASVSKQTNKP